MNGERGKKRGERREGTRERGVGKGERREERGERSTSIGQLCHAPNARGVRNELRHTEI